MSKSKRDGVVTLVPRCYLQHQLWSKIVDRKQDYRLQKHKSIYKAFGNKLRRKAKIEIQGYHLQYND